MTTLELRPLEVKKTVSYVEVQGRLAGSAMSALADEVSRKIILSASKASRTVGEISEEQGIPQSTCYRRMNELLSQGLVIVDRFIVTSSGRHATYRSCFSAYRILSDPMGMSVEVVLNDEVADKVRNRWISKAVDQIGGIGQ